MVGLLEVVARLELLSEEERRTSEQRGVEEGGRGGMGSGEKGRRSGGEERKEGRRKEGRKEEDEEEEEVRIGWDEEEEKEEEEKEEEVRIGWEENEVRIGWDEEEEEEEEEEVRVGWWKCRGSCGRELELNTENFHRNRNKRTGFAYRCRACSKENVVVPKGFKVCLGGCGKMLEENADNFPISKASKKGFSRYCKSCYDARYGKKDDDVPDGHQRCKGKCGKVLKLIGENFSRNKRTRSGFYSWCRSCANAEGRARNDAARGDKPKKRERPKEDLPDGHQRCMGECSRVLEMRVENFHRNKNARSGFQSTCKMCNNAREQSESSCQEESESGA